MPTIEKLLNTDWKEKFLGKGLHGSVYLKGEFMCLYMHFVMQIIKPYSVDSMRSIVDHLTFVFH